jgi:hypothetical protein
MGDFEGSRSPLPVPLPMLVSPTCRRAHAPAMYSPMYFLYHQSIHSSHIPSNTLVHNQTLCFTHTPSCTMCCISVVAYIVIVNNNFYSDCKHRCDWESHSGPVPSQAKPTRAESYPPFVVVGRNFLKRTLLLPSANSEIHPCAIRLSYTRQINVAPQRLWRTAHLSTLSGFGHRCHGRTYPRTPLAFQLVARDAEAFFFALFRLYFIMLRFIDSYHTNLVADRM